MWRLSEGGKKNVAIRCRTFCPVIGECLPGGRKSSPTITASHSERDANRDLVCRLLLEKKKNRLDSLAADEADAEPSADYGESEPDPRAQQCIGVRLVVRDV